MEARDVARSATSGSASGRTTDLTLCTPPNWTAVLFFAALGAVHLGMAIPAFVHHRWEAFLSMVLGCAFVVVAVVSWLVCQEITIQRGPRRIRLRTGYRKISVERYIPFKNVHGVRVTLPSGGGPLASRVEVLCDNEDIECPPTRIPRQEALCLSVLMGVPLIKVLDGDEPRPQLADLSRQ